MVEVVGSTPIAPTNKNKGLAILAPFLKASLTQFCHSGVFLWLRSVSGLHAIEFKFRLILSFSMDSLG